MKWVLVVVGILITSMSSGATAQGFTRAREAFELGTRLLHEGRFIQGRERLRESFELMPRSSTAYNLALAYRGTGEAILGGALLNRILGGEFGDLRTESRESALSLQAELSLMVGQLRIENLMVGPIRLVIDACNRISVGGGEVADMALDVGTHVVTASAQGFLSLETALEIVAGDITPLAVTLRGIPTETHVERRVSVGIIAVLVSAAALVVAGGILAIALIVRDEPEFANDPTFGTVFLPEP